MAVGSSTTFVPVDLVAALREAPPRRPRRVLPDEGLVTDEAFSVVVASVRPGDAVVAPLEARDEDEPPLRLREGRGDAVASVLDGGFFSGPGSPPRRRAEEVSDVGGEDCSEADSLSVLFAPGLRLKKRSVTLLFHSSRGELERAATRRHLFRYPHEGLCLR